MNKKKGKKAGAQFSWLHQSRTYNHTSGKWSRENEENEALMRSENRSTGSLLIAKQREWA